MFHKRCFVHLCYDFPIIDILCFTRSFCISLLWFPYNWYFMSQALFCISVLWIPYNWCFMFHKPCFVYRCSSFPIIGILCLTSVVLYICVLLSLLLVFCVSQALFCISLLWFPYNCYFMFHQRCFVYLCSAFLIIGILCFTSVVLYIFVMISPSLIFYVSQALFCIFVLWFPYNWYFMFHKSCFVYLCYNFAIIDILCFTSVVLYICVMISP